MPIPVAKRSKESTRSPLVLLATGNRLGCSAIQSGAVADGQQYNQVTHRWCGFNLQIWFFVFRCEQIFREDTAQCPLSIQL